MEKRDYYEVLEVEKTASVEEIKKRGYRSGGMSQEQRSPGGADRGGRNRPVRRPLRPRWRRRAPADDHQYPFYLLRRTRRPGEQLSADGRPPGPGGGCPQSEPQKSPHQSESGRRGPGIRPQDRQLLRPSPI